MSPKRSSFSLTRWLQDTPYPQRLWVLALACIAGLVPLITRLKAVTLTSFEARYAPVFIDLDTFNYYKGFWLVLLSLPLVWALFRQGVPTRKEDKTFWWCGLFFAATFIFSSISTLSPITALRGGYDHYEGLLVWLAYGVVLLAGATLPYSFKSLSLLWRMLLASATIIGGIGLLQFMGWNIWSSPLGDVLINPLFSDEFYVLHPPTQHRLYATFGNSNYAGSYFAMLFPFSLVVYTMAISRRQQLAAYAFALLMCANWIGCRSRAGWVGGLTAAFFFLLVYRHWLLRHWQRGLALALGCLMVLGGMWGATQGALLGKVNLEGLSVDDALHREEEVILGLTTLPHGSLEVVTNHQTFYIAFDGEELDFLNQEGEFLPYEPLSSTEETDPDYFALKIAAPGYEAFSFEFSVAQLNQFTLNAEGMRPIPLALTPAGVKGLRFTGEPIELGEVERMGFHGRERMGSGRGYLYAYSLPLLKDTVLLGYGPDQYPFHFPQNDLLGKSRFLGGAYIVATRPHNLYLQIALTAGAPSLFAFLGMVVAFWWRGISSLLLRINKKSNDAPGPFSWGTACWLAAMGYLVAGIFNDSMTSTSPVFFLLLGIGWRCFNELKANRLSS